MYILALWLETIGFGLSAVLILLVKWNILKGINDYIKSLIIKTPIKISRFKRLLNAAISSYWNEIADIEEKKKTAPWWEIKYLDDSIWQRLVFIFVIWIFFVPLYIANYITKYLSGKRVITNILIVVGTFMIMAGLIIELIIANYLKP